MGVTFEIVARTPDEYLSQYWSHIDSGLDPMPIPFWWDGYQKAGGDLTARTDKKAAWYVEFVGEFEKARATNPNGVIRAEIRFRES